MHRLAAGLSRLASRRPYTVLSFGSNSERQLGRAADAEMAPIDCLPSCQRIFPGHFHFLALADDGQLWSWGRGTEGQLGWSDRSRTKQVGAGPVHGLDALRIVSAAASGVVSFAVDAEGGVWSWGASEHGQLGHGPNILRSEKPRRIAGLAGRHVVAVAAGWGHAHAVDAAGDVISWGHAGTDNRLGFANQLVGVPGHLNALPVVWVPTPVSAPPARALASCYDHSVVIEATGGIRCFGDSSQGQMPEPGSLPVGYAVIAVTVGLAHTLVLARPLSGAGPELLSWGWNGGGQLGRPTIGDCCPRPLAVTVSDDGDPPDLGAADVRLAAGRVHSMLTTGGRLWSWGDNRHGRCGLGAGVRASALPAAVEGLSGVMGVSCTLDSTAVLIA